MNIGEIFASIIGVLVVVYVGYLLITSFCQTTPSFCNIGFTLLGALVIGAVLFLKYGWQK